MLPQEVIARKRDGGTLTADAIRFMVEGLTTGAISEGQIAAFAMAVFFRGLDADERVALTLAMRDSGAVLAWDLPGPVVDKRPRPYRRHARQVRRHPRLRHPA